MSKNRSELEMFKFYCEAHPEERFWQALRNWSGYFEIVGKKNDEHGKLIEEDTFYLD